MLYKQNRRKRDNISIKYNEEQRNWFWVSGILAVLFLLYTAMYATGALNISTLQVEQWLMFRPLTRVDCVFYEWRNLGEVPSTTAFLIVASVICLRWRYNWRVVLVFFVLLGIAIGVEVVGKMLWAQPSSEVIDYGMGALICPQLNNLPSSERVWAAFGAWWMMPPVPANAPHILYMAAHAPIVLDGDNANSYPGGHGIRDMYIGIVGAWLAWRHVRLRVVRWAMTIVCSSLAVLGGFMQFYIGSHFITDTIAGYLLGGAIACCAIGSLLHYQPQLVQGSVSQQSPSLSAT